MERNGCFLFLSSQVDIEPNCPAIDRGYLATPFGTLRSALSRQGSRYFGTFSCTTLYVITSAPPFTFPVSSRKGIGWPPRFSSITFATFLFSLLCLLITVTLKQRRPHRSCTPIASSTPLPWDCLASSRQPGGGLSKGVAVSSPELRLTNGLPWISDVVALSPLSCVLGEIRSSNQLQVSVKQSRTASFGAISYATSPCPVSNH
jgi:hypothetical protein